MANLDDNHNENEGQNNEPNTDVNIEDLQIENKALKELLAENKKTIDELNKTMAEVKTSNAKLMSQLDIGSNKKSVDDLINEQFNKYFKKG